MTDQPVRHAPFFAENDFTLFSNITKAADNHTRIISISDCFTIEYIPSDIVHIELLHRAIRYAYDRKVVIVAGVGEGNQDKSICGGPQELFKDGDGGIEMHRVYPASFKEVLAIGASEIDDKHATYSDWGTQVIYAPVPSTSLGIWSTWKDGKYELKAGTSYAAPQVAALAALILSVNKDLTIDQVVNIIKSTADKSSKEGLGRINVYRALMVASGKPDPGEYPLPAPVINLSVVVDEFTPPSVLLRWDIPFGDYAGAHIYRKNIADGSISQLEGGLITGTSYKDEHVSYKETYQYFVFSVDSRGQESVDYLTTINITINPPPSVIAYLRDGNIWTMNEDGSGEKQITDLNLARPDFLPSFYWSPDGTKIAFPFFPVPIYQNPYTISIINADGSNRIDIPNYQTARMDDFSDISWSPDGQAIAFTSTNDNWHYDIYTIKNDGSNITNITNNQRTGYVYFVAWSPDGSHLAFLSNIFSHHDEDLYIMNLDDMNWVNVTNIPDNVLQDLIIHGTVAFPHFLRWSPNGDLIAFAGLAQGTPYCGAIGTPADCREVQNIFIASADGNSIRNLTGPGGFEGRYDWSPDGKKIAFETNRDGNWEIYVINTDGSGINNLSKNQADDRSPSWSPDGKNIIFVSNRDGNQEIYKFNLATVTQTRLTNTENNESLAAYQPYNTTLPVPPIQITPTPTPSLINIDLTDPNDVITWFSYGLEQADISIFEKIITEDTLLYGTGMAMVGGRDKIAKSVFLQELAARLPSHPTCVGYNVNPEGTSLSIWTQGWQPLWDLLGVPTSDVLRFNFSLQDGTIYTSAYFTPGPRVLELPSVKSSPCPSNGEGTSNPTSTPGSNKSTAQISDQIAEVSLRATPGYIDKNDLTDVIVKIPAGELIEIIGEPVQKDGLTWWNIKWNSYTGWIADHTGSGLVIINFNP